MRMRSRVSMQERIGALGLLEKYQLARVDTNPGVGVARVDLFANYAGLSLELLFSTVDSFSRLWPMSKNPIYLRKSLPTLPFD